LPKASNCGIEHTGTGVPSPLSPPVVGNAFDVACSTWRSRGGVSDGWTESMSAATPETSGAEKLVPSEVLKLSV
jgi:hypothetical protein